MYTYGQKSWVTPVNLWISATGVLIQHLWPAFICMRDRVWKAQQFQCGANRTLLLQKSVQENSTIRLTICSPIYQSIHPSVRPSISLFSHLSICLSIHQSIHPSFHPSSIHPSILPFIHLFIHSFIHPSLALTSADTVHQELHGWAAPLRVMCGCWCPFNVSDPWDLSELWFFAAEMFW